MKDVYIGNTPVSEAVESYLSEVAIAGSSEWVEVSEAAFRKTYRAVMARKSSPDAHMAAMDGIAVEAARTRGASERTPLRLREKVDFTYVNTGNLMPAGADSVIMIEEVFPLEPGVIEIMVPSYPWQDVRQVGEDILQGEMILPGDHVIRPLDLGALINAGVEQVLVHRRLKLGILPTGNEIVQTLGELEKGKILDSSAKVFRSYAKAYGALATVYPPARDVFEELKDAVERAVEENDILVTIAGTSAGSKDYSKDVITALGRVLVHGIAMKPGKPTILGEIKGKPVIGLPGYPVSSFFTFEVFVKPLLTHMNPGYSVNLLQGLQGDFSRVEARETTDSLLEVTLAQRVVSSLKHEEHIRMLLGHIEEGFIATPLDRSAGSTMSLVRADGILKVPQDIEGLEAGARVKVLLTKNAADIKKRLVITGSHDLILDFIADEMPLSSAHVGSMGGILSVKRGQTHLAPVHLIDETTGIYNQYLLERYFKDQAVVLMEGVRRQQGIMVKKGNPKGIAGIEDLVREDVSFVNRQRGAGTRQLLDFKLRDLKISPEAILGYTREVTTHLAVAVSVFDGGADAGIGIYSAAREMDLDFIPIGYENYDFLIPEKYLEDPRVKTFKACLVSEWFHDKLGAMGGYEVHQPGRIYKAVQNV